MGTEVSTQEIPRVVEDHSGATTQEHDALYEEALACLAVIDKHWQETLVHFISVELQSAQGECTSSRSAIRPDEQSLSDASAGAALSASQQVSSRRWRRRTAALRDRRAERAQGGGTHKKIVQL